MRDVWGFRSPGTTRTLDSHASRLRQALARAGAEGWVRVTRGVGYRLAPDLHLEPCLTERSGHGFNMPRRHRVLDRNRLSEHVFTIPALRRGLR